MDIKPVILNPRSKNITEGKSRAPNRSMYYAMGYEESDFKKPMVGVANGHSTITPCNSGLQRLADGRVTPGDDEVAREPLRELGPGSRGEQLHDDLGEVGLDGLDELPARGVLVQLGLEAERLLDELGHTLRARPACGEDRSEPRRARHLALAGPGHDQGGARKQNLQNQ